MRPSRWNSWRLICVECFIFCPRCNVEVSLEPLLLYWNTDRARNTLSAVLCIVGLPGHETFVSSSGVCGKPSKIIRLCADVPLLRGLVLPTGIRALIFEGSSFEHVICCVRPGLSSRVNVLMMLHCLWVSVCDLSYICFFATLCVCIPHCLCIQPLFECYLYFLGYSRSHLRSSQIFSSFYVHITHYYREQDCNGERDWDRKREVYRYRNFQ